MQKIKAALLAHGDHLLGKLFFVALVWFVYAFQDYYVAMLCLFVVLRPLTWTFYLAIMNLKRNRHLLTPANKSDVYLIVAVGYLLDILYNMTHGTLEHHELPRETLYTSRTWRHLHNGRKDWHDATARHSAENFLNGFDPSDWHVNLSDADT